MENIKDNIKDKIEEVASKVEENMKENKSEDLIRNEHGYLPLKEIERSIQKKFRKDTFAKFMKAIKEYELIKPGDKVAVAISGGKDSILCAKMFQSLVKFSKIPFEVEYLCMDPGYSKEHRAQIEHLYEYLEIPVKIFDSDVFAVAEYLNNESPCYMCARMRRGFLYRKARDLGCNKLALGHHFNDVIETNMLNILWGGCYKVMMPKLRSKNFPEIELIRPLYLIEEESIIKWTKYSGIEPINCACSVTARKVGYTRKYVKEMIADLKEKFPMVDKSIFKSGENIHKGALLGYIEDGVKHSFLETYDQQEGDSEE